ncbi:DUF4856 domain-containing protein [Solitalea koreensis]|uniref:DUF4856 domain-containing protein n=1 Tax=Solitalea koreensis TaxID=543615 RepID=A0A521E7M7_9SPHI|nr:DUF4856 domain-containing protein [Solitalea koreensis]SMO79958.1 protein of unknown function [Solitalea koreensis]
MKRNNVYLLGATSALLLAGFTSCKKDDVKPSLRPAVVYTKLVEDTKYDNTNTLFVDAAGASTVDVSTGNFRYRVFQGINTYANTWKTQTVDANVLKKMFANTDNPFTATTNPAPADYTALNASGVQLRNVTAASLSATDAEAVRTKIESDFTTLATISISANIPAVRGVAGYVLNASNAKTLVDTKGFETTQIIQKGLIGAFSLDYISNVLLNKGLDADNYTLVAGKNYTQLEQNWDEAYGSLTLNPIYLAGSTDSQKGTAESFLGSYIWEYNKANYAKIYPAFLKGRAAIVNNDKTELKAQALFIRTQMEKAIAAAALGYLGKWKTGTDEGTRAHAIGEGLGFIYSLRFATIHGANAKFSDDILSALVGSSGGYWDLTNDKINAADAAIRAKFAL